MIEVPRNLGDGLVLRAARPEDADALVELNGRLHAEPGEDPDGAIMDWTRDLFELPHPTFRVGDTTVVEDTTTGHIVSTVCTIPQVWSYAGVSIPVGRPELVATEADYRRRGLVRAQFDVIHERGDAAGELLQFITGIPWYYRQFDYSYALDLRPQPSLAPGAKPIAADPRWSVRPATADDVVALADIDAAAAKASPALGCVRDEATWSLELVRRPGGNPGCRIYVIDDLDGEVPVTVGYVVHQHRPWGGRLPVRAVELRPGVSWLGPTQAVLAHVQQAQAELRRTSEGATSGVTFALAAEHPLVRCARTHLTQPIGDTYGLYVRVADIVALLRAVAPALEARLEASPAVGHTGELRIDLYTEGLVLVFEDGRLAAVEPWRAADSARPADAAMPREAFWSLVLGNRSIAELERLTADCTTDTDEGSLLLEVLFPVMPARGWWLS